jgi:hypothetical protein
MTLYTVLEPPDGQPDRVVFIPEGFAWGGFVFTWIWALWNRMWVIAALLFAAFAGLSVAVGFAVINPAIGSLLQFGISVLFGFEARQLQFSSLKRTGYRSAGMIEASGLEAAELSYFAARKPPSSVPASARYRGTPEDTLGIFGNV